MIFFTPLYKSLPWGGRRMAELFGRSLPDGPVGESWELVELPEAHSQAAAGGTHPEGSLGDLWRAGALGGSARGPFPFMLKWIDAAQSLSVQVHPDEAACARMGKGNPKTEAWYMVDRLPGAALLMGHHPGLDGATLLAAAAGGSLPKWLHEVPANPGEIYMLRAGTLHAIGAGCLLLEVQQPSDTTYRVYDWGRVGLDGTPRQLHLEEAVEATHFDRPGPPRLSRSGVDGPCFALRLLPTGSEVIDSVLRVFVADRGPARLQHSRGTLELARGQVVVAEPADGAVVVGEGSVVLLTEAPAAATA
jgi:mannose-6-phosphate isomerase